MTGATGPVDVLIVDDSPTVRAVVRRLLERAEGIRVVGEAADGAQAVEQVVALRPAVVLMDIEMPVMDGLAACERIASVRPTPVLVLTSRANRDHVHTAFEAMRRGATEVFAKPTEPGGWQDLAGTLPAAVRAVAAARSQAAPVPQPRTERTASVKSVRPRAVRFVAIGASTGGPEAVRQLLASLPRILPATVLVVQHIAPGFEEGLAEWLGGSLGRDVKVARAGEAAAEGVVRIAPNGAHLLLDRDGTLRLDAASPARGGHRPSVDELFLSCVHAHPRETAGVLLTGMGSDGADGLAALHDAGALTLVQDEASSVVFGMPRAALERGATKIALPPQELGQVLARCWQGEKERA